MAYKYSKFSPYFSTSLNSNGVYLDLLDSRLVPASVSDATYVIDNKYDLRPDLLAYDLYGDSNLWWVFAERNPNTLKDPVGDFRTGVAINLPDKNSLISALGA
jgi:hypothetical protein